MRWRGRRQSSNIQDYSSRSGGTMSRGGSGGRGGGFRLPGGFGRPRMRAGRVSRRRTGGGFGSVLLLLGLFFLLKMCSINPLDILVDSGGMSNDRIMPPEGRTTRVEPVPLPRGPDQPELRRHDSGTISTNAELKQFIGVVLAESEDVWNGIFKQAGRRYPEPKLVLFSRHIRSACGQASAATGPFYCPVDDKVYLDTSFFHTLERQFGAYGDFAKAYVIAHEIGHHVQNVLGVLPEFNRMRQSMRPAQANQMSVRVELQADCYAGIWAYYTAKKGLLERGDLEEALNAAMQIGDDAIQKRTQGYVVPEQFNHGTSEQRRGWFLRGYETGKVRDCNTKIFD